MAKTITAGKHPVQHGTIPLCRRLHMVCRTHYDDPEDDGKRMNGISRQSADDCKQRLRHRVSWLRVYCLGVALWPSYAILPGQNADYSREVQATDVSKDQGSKPFLGPAAAVDKGHSPPQETNAALLQAKSLIHLAKYAQAELALRQALQRQPFSAQLLYLLAHVQQLRNQPRDSLATLTAAAQIVQPSGEEVRIAVLDYVLLNDYNEALQWSARAVTMDPQNAEAWYDLGRVQMHEGRFDAAIDAFQRSLVLRPANPKTLDNLGVCLENQNRPVDALARYMAAIEATAASANPSEQPYLNAGKLLVTRNSFAEALPLLRRATELAPSDADTYAALASAYVGLRQTTEARSAMENAVRLDPNNPRLHYRMARIYRSAGEPILADRELKQSAAMYGDHSTE